MVLFPYVYSVNITVLKGDQNMNVIYYFSGRGNSLKTTLDLSRRLEDTIVIPIRDGVRTDHAEDAETIGIITPVIDFGVPAYVLRFIDRLQAANKDVYIYAVITNGGMPCAAAEQLRKRLKRNGLALSAEFPLTFGLGWSASEEWLGQIDRIAALIRQKQGEKSNITWKDLLFTLANHLAKRLIPSEDRKFSLNEKCTGCGVCEKICPANNIRLTNGKPVWMHSCEQCAACFNWCPSEAIEGKNLAARTHFTNPEITLEQMLINN